MLYKNLYFKDRTLNKFYSVGVRAGEIEIDDYDIANGLESDKVIADITTEQLWRVYFSGGEMAFEEVTLLDHGYLTVKDRDNQLSLWQLQVDAGQMLIATATLNPNYTVTYISRISPEIDLLSLINQVLNCESEIESEIILQSAFAQNIDADSEIGAGT